MRGAELTAGPRSGQGRRPGQRAGLDRQHLQVVVEHKRLATLLGAQVASDRDRPVLGDDLLGTDADPQPPPGTARSTPLSHFCLPRIAE
jgi:hypothetical protein